MENVNKEYCLYIIFCIFEDYHFLKIGRTINLKDRIKNIQTGCPHKINNVFVIKADHELELKGLEEIMHFYLKKHSINNEWYLATKECICIFLNLLDKINKNNFDFDELEVLSEETVSDDAFEIIMHYHEYSFYEMRKEKGNYIIKSNLTSDEFFARIINNINH